MQGKGPLLNQGKKARYQPERSGHGPQDGMNIRPGYPLLVAATLVGCATSLPPNRSTIDPSDPSAMEAAARPLRTNLIASTQIYLDPSVGKGAQQMRHKEGMSGMDHSKMQSSQTDHSKMPGTGRKPPAEAKHHKHDMDHSHPPPIKESLVEAGDGPTAPYYTCPMHPEVRQHGPGECPKCGMALVKKETQEQKK